MVGNGMNDLFFSGVEMPPNVFNTMFIILT